MLTKEQLEEAVGIIGEVYRKNLEGLSDDAKTLFVKMGNGFRLKTAEDIDALKNTNAAIRQERDQGMTRIRELETQFNGIDPKEVAEMREKLQAIGDKKLLDAQGQEVLRESIGKEIASQWQGKVASLDEKCKYADAIVDECIRRWKEDRIKSQVARAVLKADGEVDPDLYQDLENRALRDWDVTDDGKDVAYKEDSLGTKIIWPGSDGANSIDYDGWVAHYQETVPGFWLDSEGTGARGVRHQARNDKAAWEKQSPEERLVGAFGE